MEPLPAAPPPPGPAAALDRRAIAPAAAPEDGGPAPASPDPGRSLELLLARAAPAIQKARRAFGPLATPHTTGTTMPTTTTTGTAPNPLLAEQVRHSLREARQRARPSAADLRALRADRLRQAHAAQASTSLPPPDHDDPLRQLHQLALRRAFRPRPLGVRLGLRRAVLLEQAVAETAAVDGLHDHRRLVRAPLRVLPLEHIPIGNAQATRAQLAVLRAVGDEAARNPDPNSVAAQQGMMAEMAARAAQEARVREIKRLAAEERRRQRADFDRRRHEFDAKLRVLKARRRFLAEVVDHRQDQNKLASLAGKRAKQRTDGVVAWHSRERRRKIREANARVMALKENNMEEYLKIAQNAKDGRVKTLLNKTEGILVELGMKIAEQVRAIVEAPAEPEPCHPQHQQLGHRPFAALTPTTWD